MPLRKKLPLEKVDLAERQVVRVRFATVFLGTALAFVQPEISTLEIVILVGAWIYAIAHGWFALHHYGPMSTAIFSTVMDAVVSTLWIHATGGWDSPWFLLFYLGIVAISLRFSYRETILSAAVYAASYLVLLGAVGEIGRDPAELVLRVAFLFLVASVSGTHARETVDQILDRLEVEDRERQARAAESTLRTLLSAQQELRSIRLRAEESERRRIALELHDQIGQMLTGLKLSLEAGERRPAEEAARTLAAARESVHELMTRVRGLSLDLRPAMLDDLGLVPALLSLASRWSAQTGIAVDVRHRGLELRLPPEIETVAFRVVQEALTNVARHAKGARVAVRAWTNEEGLCVQVEDDGQGFDPSVPANGTGLAGMRERAMLAGGTLAVDAAPGRGTCLTLEVPLVQKERGGDTPVAADGGKERE